MSALRPLASALREGTFPSQSLFDRASQHQSRGYPPQVGGDARSGELDLPNSKPLPYVCQSCCLVRGAVWSSQGVYAVPAIESLVDRRPEILLSESRRASIFKLMHIKVENSACYDLALLNHVVQYNDRQEVLNSEGSRLTNMELFNCPDVAVGVMKQLRLLKCVEEPVLRQLRKHEELTTLFNVAPLPRRPPHPYQYLPQKVYGRDHSQWVQNATWLARRVQWKKYQFMTTPSVNCQCLLNRHLRHLYS